MNIYCKARQLGHTLDELSGDVKGSVEKSIVISTSNDSNVVTGIVRDYASLATDRTRYVLPA
eukprot:1378153-Amorphochlora_amoeboformis.AAC.1